MILLKLIAIILVAVMLLPIGLTASAQTGFANFVHEISYVQGQFEDVNPDDWFSGYVRYAYNFGLIKGRGETAFAPHGMLTLGEAVALAARLRSIYHTGHADFPPSEPFYAVYAEYALENGIIAEHGNYGAFVTRTHFASIIFNSLPEEFFVVVNEIPPFGIVDVSYSADTNSIYALYRAGVLSGSDRFGTFLGSTHISRAEVSAILVRVVDRSSRIEMTLPSSLPVEELFIRSSSAAFMIETFGIDNESIRTGSGFFIDESGLAVTALHVLDNAHSATIELFSGEIYPILGIRAINEEFNLAIIQVDSEKNGWSYLTLADSDTIEVGNTVFAIGSPHSLINSISEGIVAFSSRTFDEESMIQFTAPISFGSGGGPILNALGQVVGVASSSFTHGQNINLAIPVNLVRNLVPGEIMTFEEYWNMKDA